MIYDETELTAFPLNKWIPYNWSNYLIGDIKGNIFLVSKFNFSIISKIKLKYNVYFNFKNFIYCYHTEENRIKKLNVNSLETSQIEGNLIPVYLWDNYSCHFNFHLKRYIIKDKNDRKLFTFTSGAGVIRKYCKQGIVQIYKSEKTFNWLHCISPNGIEEKWRLNYKGNIFQHYQFEELLILHYREYKMRTDKGYEGLVDWNHPNYFTIVIDTLTGKELYKVPLLMKIDKENGVLVTSRTNKYDKRFGRTISASALEFDIRTGDVLTEIEVTPVDKFSYSLNFVDETGIYYTTHYGSFGKIRKKDGVIDWEYDLIDSTGKKRKLSNWLLLGNGKLALQAMPNTGEDLIYLFDPKENFGFANILDGKRITSIKNTRNHS